MSVMLLLECVSCKKRQQIRQGLVQACACGGADFKAPGAFGSTWVASLWRKSSVVGVIADGAAREREDAIESAEGETAEKAFATLVYKLRERAANDARKRREEAEWKQAELDTWDRQEWRGEEAKR